MDAESRWDLAITHRADEAPRFISEYFESKDREVLFIAGAGFDPRATIIGQKLAALKLPTIHAALIKESRPESDATLRQLATDNLKVLADCFPAHQLLSISIFGQDNSVTGGRASALAVSALNLGGITDVVVDISALSIGTSFPIIRWMVEEAIASRPDLNIHVVVAHQPELDARIKAVPSDIPVSVHGFNGRMSLSSVGQRQAKLWLPQLAAGRAASLRRIHDVVIPDEVCVVLPFPANHPRIGDALLVEMLETGGIPWEMDSRSIVYADESDPLDLYRTIMRLHALREPVFAETGGSTLILSPVGSKVMALGALLAGLERDLPVMYLEDFGYEFVGASTLAADQPELMHVWLEGSPYTFPRPALTRAAGA
ncbi:hypothetical protein BH11ACT4_BH11ACT4_08120 [soil metagenome]